jgi:hypothetical protein
MRDCEGCNGTGTVEVMNCKNQSSDCCGGCYKDAECDMCEGSGTYEYWHLIEDEFSTMVKDWDLTKEELQILINNTNFKK